MVNKAGYVIIYIQQNKSQDVDSDLFTDSIELPLSGLSPLKQSHGPYSASLFYHS